MMEIFFLFVTMFAVKKVREKRIGFFFSYSFDFFFNNLNANVAFFNVY